MDTRNLNGFRICIKLCIGNNADSRKCFIFINEEWSKIKFVQDHIKKIFYIDEEVNIYIGDVLLPENETIKLIQPDDILIIKTIEPKKDDTCSKRYKLCPTDFLTHPKSNSLPMKKSKVIPVPTNADSLDISLSDCLEELFVKKEQIVKEIAQGADPVSNVNDSIEVEPLFNIPFKKRKRKHKKKSKLLEPSSFEANMNESDLMKFDSVNSSSQHIHFSDDDGKEEIHAFSPQKMNGNTVEEFRSSLLNLVNKPASQKIFARKSETSSTIKPKSKDFEANSLEQTPVKLDGNNSELIESATFVPKVGDLISFKKIKMGSDYTPQESNEIVGEVFSVEGTAGSYLVVFIIIEGAEEFEDPSGKFSIEVDENGHEGDKVSAVELFWKDVLKPRLKRRVQL